MEFKDQWDIEATCDYIARNGYVRVTLQFPDSMLKDSPVVAGTLQSHLAARGSTAQVYVLADTSYNPLSIDEVAAAHVNADCIIHYGYASLNPVSRTPALCVLPKAQLDVQQCSNWLAEQLSSTAEQLCSSTSRAKTQQAGEQQQQQQQQQHCAVVCCDQAYLHLLPQLQEALLQAYQGPLQLLFAKGAPVELLPQSSNRTGRSTAAAVDQPCCSSNRIGKSTAAAVDQPCCSSNRTGRSTAAAVDQPCCSSNSCQSGAALPEQQQQQHVPSTACACRPCTVEASAARQECCQREQQQQQHPQPAAQAAEIPRSSSSSSSSRLPPIGGLVWQLPNQGSMEKSSSSSSSAQQPLMVWLGPFNSPAATHLQLTHSTYPWLLLDPATHISAHGMLPDLQRLLKRRYYLVERARSATMIGLLVCTLGAAGYLQALQQLRQLAAKAGKKTYTLLMGKPNPAKLANFPEIEVFVMLADPAGLILDSKEYLNPIVTPHEAYLAFTDQPFDQSTYRLDFGDLLPGNGATYETASKAAAADMGGNVSSGANCEHGSDEDDEQQHEKSSYDRVGAAGALAVAGSSRQGKAMASGFGSRTGQQVQVHSAAQYLAQHRTFQGLETPATGGEILAAEKAVPGRSGRAAVYVDEPTA